MTADGERTATVAALSIDAAFLQRIWPSVARLTARLVGDDGWQDVAQEALLEAWRRRSAFDPRRGRAENWVLAIAVTQVQRFRRRQLRWVEAETAATVARAVPDHGPASDVRHDVLAAVDALPERQRLAVTLYYILDLPEADIAQVMGARIGTVKSTLAAARTSLHGHLGGYR